jgi:hypothetical protein
VAIARGSASPGSAAEFTRTVAEADISEILSAIRVPTLLLYRRAPVAVTAGPVVAVDMQQSAKEMAATIPNAHVVGLDGRDVAPFVGDEVVTEGSGSYARRATVDTGRLGATDGSRRRRKVLDAGSASANAAGWSRRKESSTTGHIRARRTTDA